MRRIIDDAKEIEELVQVHYNPLTLSKGVEELIKKELDIDTIVFHDFEDVEQYNNFYLVISITDLEEEEIEQIESLFSAQHDSVYEMTLSIIDKLFDGYASNSYVKLIDSMLYDDAPIVIEFTPENYVKFLKGN